MSKEVKQVCDYCGEQLPCLNRCYVDMDPSRDVKRKTDLAIKDKEIKELCADLSEAHDRIRKLTQFLEKLRDGPGNNMEGWKLTWAHELSTKALSLPPLKPINKTSSRIMQATKVVDPIILKSGAW